MTADERRTVMIGYVLHRWEEMHQSGIISNPPPFVYKDDAVARRVNEELAAGFVPTIDETIQVMNCLHMVKLYGPDWVRRMIAKEEAASN